MLKISAIALTILLAQASFATAQYGSNPTPSYSQQQVQQTQTQPYQQPPPPLYPATGYSQSTPQTQPYYYRPPPTVYYPGGISGYVPYGPVMPGQAEANQIFQQNQSKPPR